ncbi:MAG TPA: hypothetical protein VEZ90_06470 [Blastocatellia bacterium]|nr:hypothetical protein [Blastocatellia bacterium]
MKILALTLLVSLSGAPRATQNHTCFRVMPVDELTRESAFIARVKVAKAQKVNYRGMYSQIAELNPTDVLIGDFTLKEVNVLADSNVPCAEDSYTNGQDVLVFLVPQDSLFRTLNFQYGEFKVEGEVVKGWRDKNNNPVDRPYTEVKQEIVGYLNPAPPQPKPGEGPREGPPPDAKATPQPKDKPPTDLTPNPAATNASKQSGAKKKPSNSR